MKRTYGSLVLLLVFGREHQSIAFHTAEGTTAIPVPRPSSSATWST